MFRILKTQSIPNRESWGVKILIESSPPTCVTCHVSCVICPISSSFIICHPLSTSCIPFYLQLHTLADMSDLVCSRDISQQSVGHLETRWHQGHGFTFQAKAMAKRKYPGFSQYSSILSSASDLESRPRVALLG